MTKDKLKDDVIRTIYCLIKPKINSIDERVTALENSSQS